MYKNEDNKPVERLLTISEAADCLKVSIRQMFRFIAAGEIRPVRLTHRIIRVRPQDLDDFLGRKQSAT